MSLSSLLYSFYVACLACIFSVSHEIAKTGYELYKTDTFVLIGCSIFIQYALYYLFREKKWQSPIAIITWALVMGFASLSIYLLLSFNLDLYNLIFGFIAITLPLLYYFNYNRHNKHLSIVKPFILSLNWINYTILLPLAMENRFHELNLGFTLFSLTLVYTICLCWELKNKITPEELSKGLVGIMLSICSMLALFAACDFNYHHAFIYIIFFSLLISVITLCVKYRHKKIWFIVLDSFLALLPLAMVCDFIYH